MKLFLVFSYDFCFPVVSVVIPSLSLIILFIWAPSFIFLLGELGQRGKIVKTVVKAFLFFRLFSATRAGDRGGEKTVVELSYLNLAPILVRAVVIHRFKIVAVVECHIRYASDLGGNLNA